MHPHPHLTVLPTTTTTTTTTLLHTHQVQTDLLDVNKNIFDEMERHTKAMSAIYARHSETSSSDLNSGASTPDTERGAGGIGLGDWDPDGDGPDLKDCIRTSLTAGTPIADEGVGEDRADDLLEQERFEKSIFVKAALQLLLERASSGSGIMGGGGEGVGGGPKILLHDEGGERSTGGLHGGVIKAGYLKKAAHHSMGTIWKTKQVEIHPGLFVYEDDDNLLGKRKKTIRLVMGVCGVRIVASGRKGHVFELSAKKGQKRLWMCSSEEDRSEWIKAIHEATVATPSSADGLSGHVNMDSPYATDMEMYKRLRSSFEQATDARTYCEALQELHHGEQICVPFSWIRTQISDVFPMEASSALMTGLHHGGGGANAGLTQLWKDMMRDKVCINGQVIYGESGPESILGALARCLVTLAARAREHECITSSSSKSPPSSLLTSFAPTGSGGSPGTTFLTPHASLSTMNEVQAVAYTMEVLLACNRTQSGGDTYYCVEYLFRNPALVVLCPYSSHAEPLQIFLELIDEPIDTSLDVMMGTPVLSDDEGSLLAGCTGAATTTMMPINTAALLGTTTTTSSTMMTHHHHHQQQQHTQKDFKERSRKVQSVRLTSSSTLRHHGSHVSSTAGQPAIPRSNSLTKLTSLLPESPPPPPPPILPPSSSSSSSSAAAVVTAADPFARSLPLGGVVRSPTGNNTNNTTTATTTNHPSSGSTIHSNHSSNNSLASRSDPATATSPPPPSSSSMLMTSPGGDPVGLPLTAMQQEGVGGGGGGGGDEGGGATTTTTTTSSITNTNNHISTTGGGTRLTKPAIKVKIQANTSYKICPSDPQDDREDIWSIVSARFEQHFIISGMGMTKGQELIALTTLEGTSTTGKDTTVGRGGGGARGAGRASSTPSPQPSPSQPSPIPVNMPTSPPLPPPPPPQQQQQQPQQPLTPPLPLPLQPEQQQPSHHAASATRITG